MTNEQESRLGMYLAVRDFLIPYNTVLAQPRVGITTKSQATKQLAALFQTADAAMANMDTAVEIIRLSQVNFYNGYKSARKIIETGAGSLAVKRLVTDAQSGEPLKGVTVRFALDGGAAKLKAGNGAIEKKTAGKGGFIIKSLAAGTYQVTLQKPRYAEQVVTVEVSDGEMSEVNVGMAKA